jgi:hypothetical protein
VNEGSITALSEARNDWLHHASVIPQEVFKGPVFAGRYKLPGLRGQRSRWIMSDTSYSSIPTMSIVARLTARIREARAMGFQIRQEFLGGNPGNWCEIAGRKVVFLDSSQAAAEQLETLDQAIRTYRPAGSIAEPT